MDLLVKNTQDELILIEIQNDSEVDYFQRMLYGASKLLVEHLSKGDAYAKLKKVIAIHIVYFDLAQGLDYLYHGTTSFKGVYEHDELQLSATQRQAFKLQQIQDIYPEYYLIKVKQFQDIIRERFDEWAYFLKHEEIKDDFQAKNIHLAKEKLDVLKLPKEERKHYEAYLEGLRYEKSMFESNRLAALIEGESLGLEKGKELGLAEGKELGLAEGEQIGLEKGKQVSILMLQKTILDLLQKRFGPLMSDITQKVQALNQLDRLEQSISLALECESLAAFLLALGAKS